MITKFIPKAVTQSIGRKMLTTKANSPHIFFAAGVAGVITSTVLACHATLKVAPIIDEMEYEVDSIKKDHLPGERNKDLAHIYVKHGVSLGKLYGPSVVVGGLSIAALTGSHVQLTRRNTALAAAYSGIAKAYEAYRERVAAEVGDEKEQELYYGAELRERANPETGKMEKVAFVDPNTHSAYARFFDEYSTCWEKSPELNRLFVQCQQNYYNQLLQARGHVFLNEVYDALGLERTQAGQVVGWILGPDGDNYIDFGIFEAFNTRFVNNLERSILLDFNVDGVIFDKLG